MEIPDKDTFFRLWKEMRLGNRPRMWDNIRALEASQYNGKVSIRYRIASENKYKAYYVPVEKLNAHLFDFIMDGAKIELFTFNESMPDDDLVIQGECCYAPGGFHLTWSDWKGPMRDALESHAKQESGLAAKMVLSRHMDARDREMVEELFELYPDAAVEFGVYGRQVGVLPGHRCVIWEVRCY